MKYQNDQNFYIYLKLNYYKIEKKKYTICIQIGIFLTHIVLTKLTLINRTFNLLFFCRMNNIVLNVNIYILLYISITFHEQRLRNHEMETIKIMPIIIIMRMLRKTRRPTILVFYKSLGSTGVRTHFDELTFYFRRLRYYNNYYFLFTIIRVLKWSKMRIIS